MSVAVRQVESDRDRRDFGALPYRLYRGHPTWAPYPQYLERIRLSGYWSSKDHETIACFVAKDRNRVVGRVAACVDHLYNAFHDASRAWVGFFEATDDQEVALGLFDAALRWSKANGVSEVVGPASFNANEPIGLLVDGFEHRPMLLTPYNPPYYEGLWTGTGWSPLTDLHGWHVARPETQMTDRQRRIADRLRQRIDIRIRPVDLDRFADEMAVFFEPNDRSPWSSLHLYQPMTRADLEGLGGALRRFGEPKIAWIAERRSTSEPIGCAVALPDLNEALGGMRRGRRNLRTAWRLRRLRKHLHGVRFIAAGFIPEYQMMGLGALVASYVEELSDLRPSVQVFELSYTDAENLQIERALEQVGAKRYKTWRLYRKPIVQGAS